MRTPAECTMSLAVVCLSPVSVVYRQNEIMSVLLLLLLSSHARTAIGILVAVPTAPHARTHACTQSARVCLRWVCSLSS